VAIGGGSLLVGILVAIIGNLFVVRAKVREVDLLYRQKLADSYLATARTYTREIYVPLNVLLSQLADAYLELREHIDFENATVPASDAAAFRLGAQSFITDLSALVSRGADAFLTTDVEARLRDFRHFLASSLDAQATETKMVIQSFLGPTTSTTTSSVLPMALVAASTVASRLSSVSLWAGRWARLSVEIETLAAPLSSRAFEARFSRDLGVLKESIKLVTLGSKEPI